MCIRDRGNWWQMVNGLEGGGGKNFATAERAEDPRKWVSECNPGQVWRLEGDSTATGLSCNRVDRTIQGDLSTFNRLKTKAGLESRSGTVDEKIE